MRAKIIKVQAAFAFQAACTPFYRLTGCLKTASILTEHGNSALL
ncbi:hypothetical protein HMPREF9098_1585 [Kingella denitrificans ATCC 33394]|uniref:Uncharacterized protein n=1 Tax=Kingella denitrificans ATCC 33394 TaxID=888741 RepID=F0F0F0_9NEIS|nr:hypothetical protein HMPREF9098_1585 [Kingella denitrificans ATCC 33394]